MLIYNNETNSRRRNTSIERVGTRLMKRKNLIGSRKITPTTRKRE